VAGDPPPPPGQPPPAGSRSRPVAGRLARCPRRPATPTTRPRPG
jgi:hypothetical protein